jgi:hypothetical protein
MMKRSGLKVVLAAASFTVLLPSSVAFSQTMPVGGGIGGLADSIGGALGFGGGRSTKAEQLAQIALQKQELSAALQMLEHFEIGNELMGIFQQSLGIQNVVEEVIHYEVPGELTQRYEIISPVEHERLTRERQAYMNDLDAEIADLEAALVLDENQFESLAVGIERIQEPRSDKQAIQAQFVADQARLEHDRRKAAIEILRNKRDDMRRQIEEAHNNSQAAALKCIDSPIDVKC